MNLQEIGDNLKPPFYSKYSQCTGNVQDKIVSILKVHASRENNITQNKIIQSRIDRAQIKKTSSGHASVS